MALRGFGPSSVVLLATLAAGSGCASSSPKGSLAPPPLAPAVAAAPSAAETAPPAHDRGEPALEDVPGWLGVELAAPLRGEAGVLIRDVLRHSPAARAGLMPGDRIVRIDSEPVARPPDVVRIVSSHRAGERVGVVFVREGADRMLPVVLEGRPDQDALLRAQFLGAPAPAWAPLATVRGSAPGNIGELRGQVVVMEFWASWCVACRLTVPTLNAWKDRYGAQGLTVLGVTTDTPALAMEASVELGIDYPVLSDDDAETSRAYRAMALPTLFIIDREGIVRDVMVGYSSARLAEAEATLRRLVGAGTPPVSP